MTIDKKVEEIINSQINAEMYSAYIYMSMAAYFHSTNLPGFASWMEQQAKEEMTHAAKFFKYVNERGGRVILKSIDGPKTEWTSPLNVFEEVYKHEQHVTSLINKIMDVAVSEKDRATEVMLHWFINEQVEEEANASAIVEKLKMAGDSRGALLYIDKELGKRGND